MARRLSRSPRIYPRRRKDPHNLTRGVPHHTARHPALAAIQPQDGGREPRRAVPQHVSRAHEARLQGRRQVEGPDTLLGGGGASRRTG